MSCLKDGQWYVAGITSWGIAWCEGIPAVYTRVSMYELWIGATMDFYRPSA